MAKILWSTTFSYRKSTYINRYTETGLFTAHGSGPPATAPSRSRRRGPRGDWWCPMCNRRDRWDGRPRVLTADSGCRRKTPKGGR